ncbi:MAG: NAD-dependent epimerase/dehydratase family protein [Thermoanaerobaculaceae bacterium]|nr:NAD-dependent epimerase/dehydratase family protein [Thermoanaerobaculaceae bacterium]
MGEIDGMQVILGAGGAIGTPLATELLASGARLRTVSRSGAGPDGAERVRADLTDAGAVLGAVEEGSTVYLLAGLPYDRGVWRSQWPPIMRNVVAACASKRARLVFFDNVYMYGKFEGPMTEATPVKPASAKGAVRAEIAGFLQGEMAAGRVTALIARAADFYGPYAERSGMPSILVLQRLAAGRAAQVLARADAKHSYTYTLDCARALPLLAGADDAYGQVWHLPTARPPLTGREFVDLAARELGVPARLTVTPRWTVRAAGVFNTLLREVGEMLYQNEGDYEFDSAKFETRFAFAPTPYEAGIRQTVARMRGAAQTHR